MAEFWAGLEGRAMNRLKRDKQVAILAALFGA
jgi:hypothetical protein